MTLTAQLLGLFPLPVFGLVEFFNRTSSSANTMVTTHDSVTTASFARTLSTIEENFIPDFQHLSLSSRIKTYEVTAMSNSIYGSVTYRQGVIYTKI